MILVNDDVGGLPPLATKKQVAEWLGSSTRNVELQVKAQRFPPPVRIGTHPRWRRSDLLNWLDEQQASLSR